MLKSIRYLVLASTLMSTVMAGSATAAPIVYNPWHSAGNGSQSADDYGNIPNMDLLYTGRDSLGDSAVTGHMRVWALYGTLFQVSYADVFVGDIFLRPDAGWTEGVSLYSFDIGSYYGSEQDTQVRVYNGDYSSLLFQQNYTLGASAVTVSPSLSSLNGLHIQFSGEPGWVAIDNITIEAGSIFSAAVPEPASWAMMISGFGLLGAAMRRRNQGAALLPA